MPKRLEGESVESFDGRPIPPKCPPESRLPLTQHQGVIYISRVSIPASRRRLRPKSHDKSQSVSRFSAVQALTRDDLIRFLREWHLWAPPSAPRRRSHRKTGRRPGPHGPRLVATERQWSVP